MHERKDNEQQNIINFQFKAYITEKDNSIILFIMNIKRINDYVLIRKIETLMKNKIYKKKAEFKLKNLISAYVLKFNQ